MAAARHSAGTPRPARSDEGRTWQRAGEGLAETVINSITLDPTDLRMLYAATYGGGVLQLDLDEP